MPRRKNPNSERHRIGLDDLRTNYGLYYLAMNPTFGYTYYQQVLLTPVFDGIVRGNPQFNRVMNIEPFRHSKTTLGTINFVPYYFGHHPDQTIMVLAYNHKRARTFGRAIRDIMQKHPLYRELFPDSQIAKSSHAADEFETVAGGHFYAGGFDTGINGIGGNGVVIDDPHKNMEDVTSEANSTKWKSIYDNVISNRCEPGAWILANSTRWGILDFLGWRIKEDKAFDYLHGGVPYTDEPMAPVETVH